MKIGDKVYCYNTKNGKKDSLNFKDIEIGQSYTITNITDRKRSHRVAESGFDGVNEYISLGLSIFSSS